MFCPHEPNNQSIGLDMEYGVEMYWCHIHTVYTRCDLTAVGMVESAVISVRVSIGCSCHWYKWLFAMRAHARLKYLSVWKDFHDMPIHIDYIWTLNPVKDIKLNTYVARIWLVTSVLCQLVKSYEKSREGSGSSRIDHSHKSSDETFHRVLFEVQTTIFPQLGVSGFGNDWTYLMI